MAGFPAPLPWSLPSGIENMCVQFKREEGPYLRIIAMGIVAGAITESVNTESADPVTVNFPILVLPLVATVRSRTF